MSKKTNVIITGVTASAIISSAFVAPATSQAAGQSNAQQVVRESASVANGLKTYYNAGQIEVSTEFLTQYNLSKVAVAKAKIALNGYKGSDKKALNNEILNAEQHILRAARYIDAVKAVNSMEENRKALELHFKEDHLTAESLSDYKKLGDSIAKSERVIGKVYGTDTRKSFLTKYMTASKIAKETIIYEVSIYQLQEKISDLVKAGNTEAAKNEFAKLERLAERALDVKKQGEKLHPGKYQALEKVNMQLKQERSKMNEVLNPAPVSTPSPAPSPSPSSPVTPTVISEAGTFENKTIDGDVTVTVEGVTLKNLHIKGDLILEEGIGEGDVFLNGVTVEGQTLVKGGGENSIHFEDSVLAKVVVQKEGGKVRIVASGTTTVSEVLLETPAKVEEKDLDAAVEGFTNVTVSESFQSAAPGLRVDLLGAFDIVTNKAADAKIQLSDTSIISLVLNAAANVAGTGVIETADVSANANGSVIAQQPSSLVVAEGAKITVNDEEVITGYTVTEYIVKNTLATAVKGTAHGNYPESAVQALEQALQSVEAIKGTASKEEMDRAIRSLTEALEDFRYAKVTTAKGRFMDQITEYNNFKAYFTIGTEIGNYSKEAVDQFIKDLEEAEEISHTEGKTELEYQEAGNRLEDAFVVLIDSSYGYDSYRVQAVGGTYNSSDKLNETPAPGTEPNKLFPEMKPFKINLEVIERKNSAGQYKGALEIGANSDFENQLWHQKADGEWINLMETKIPFGTDQTIEVYPVWSEGENLTVDLFDIDGRYLGSKRDNKGVMISNRTLNFTAKTKGPVQATDVQNEKGHGSIDVTFNYPVFSNIELSESPKLSDFKFTFDDEGDGGASNFHVNSITSTEGTPLTGEDTTVRFQYTYSGDFDDTDNVQFSTEEKGLYFKELGQVTWDNIRISLKVFN